MKVIKNGKYFEMSEEEMGESLPPEEPKITVEELLERIRILEEEKQQKEAKGNEA